MSDVGRSDVLSLSGADMDGSTGDVSVGCSAEGVAVMFVSIDSVGANIGVCVPVCVGVSVSVSVTVDVGVEVDVCVSVDVGVTVDVGT